MKQGISLLWLLLLGGMTLAAHADTQSEAEPSLAAIRNELEGPVRLLLENGSQASGQIVHWDGKALKLEVTMDAGQAQMTYAAEDLKEIHFSGVEHLSLLQEWMQQPGRAEDALALFNAFYQQRQAYLSYSRPAELDLFVEYVRFALEQGEALLAIALVEDLRPLIQDAGQLDSLDEAVLLASFQVGMHEEAAQRAEVWVESASPAGDSALGWRILAELRFDDEKYEEALWTALYPIAFAHQNLPEHLDLCYAFAIAAAQETRQKPIAERLIREMRQRGLEWPAHHAALEGYRPEPPAPASTESAASASEEELTDPLQTPSPRDPMQSLPTRIYKGMNDGRDET